MQTNQQSKVLDLTGKIKCKSKTTLKSVVHLPDAAFRTILEHVQHHWMPVTFKAKPQLVSESIPASDGIKCDVKQEERRAS